MATRGEERGDNDGRPTVSSQRPKEQICVEISTCNEKIKDRISMFACLHFQSDERVLKEQHHHSLIIQLGKENIGTDLVCLVLKALIVHPSSCGYVRCVVL